MLGGRSIYIYLQNQARRVKRNNNSTNLFKLLMPKNNENAGN